MRLAMLAAFAVLWASGADAASLCVKTGGSDATAKASISYVPGSEAGSTCWATILRAARGSTTFDSPNSGEAAAAGDTVYVFAGAYTTTGRNARQTPAFNPINSGTSGNPIVFESLGAETITFTSGIGPVIGAEGVDYITWRGFSIDETLAPPASDTGPVVLWICTGCIIEYCDISSNGVEPGFGHGELHNGIRVNAGGSNIIRNNYIHGFVSNSAGANGSAILLDHSAGGTVEHNEIYDSDGGIFIKRNYTAEGAWTWRFNNIHDNDYCMRADQLTDTTPNHVTLIYQNICRNITNGALSSNHYVTVETYDLTMVNNTIVGCDVGFDGAELTASASHIFWNNVVTGCNLGFRTAQLASDWTSSVLDAQHNSYYTVTNAMTYRYDLGGQTTINWATWVALPQDNSSPASLTSSDPLFANSAGNDYRLCTGSGTPHASCSGASPAIAIGVDILDLDGDGSTSDNIPAGAYITGNETIGVQSSGSSGTVRLRTRGEDQ